MSSETPNDILFEGSVGIYRQVELEKWGDASVLVSFDSDLKSLGFIFLGDLLCSAVASIITRGYFHPTDHVRAILVVGVKEAKLSVFGLFFDSRYINGAVATTTNSKAVKHIPSQGIHRRICPWKGVYDLYSQHQALLNELKTGNGETLPIGVTLLSMAESLDAFTVRMSSLRDDEPPTVRG